MSIASTLPLPIPVGALLSSGAASAGLPITALDRIKLFSPTQWEEFVLEWAHSLKTKYSSVERCAGAGDMGRDVIAFDKTNPTLWENYQCKHYGHRLTPVDIWLELGKFVYYTFAGEYTTPQKYFFVAPQGIGTKLSKLLKNDIELKIQLIANWAAYCQDGITSKNPVPLDQPLRQHLDALDFEIFRDAALSPVTIIEQHQETRWHVMRFGGGLPPRPKPAHAPGEIAGVEASYVQCLLDAYEDHVGGIRAVSDLLSHSDLSEHFQDARREFYSAEALKAFSRDTLPPDAFDELQNEVHGGIKDEVRSEHSDGYRRVLAVVKAARFLPITNHPLVGHLSTYDRGGICHQLANDGKIKWKR